MAAPLPVLWWNNTVVVAQGPKPVSTVLSPDGDAVLGLCAFLEALTPAPATVRLFYFSQTLEYSPTTCPKGSRKTIQRALGARFPSLENPLTAWAAHKVRSHAAGSTTLLYIEQDGRLAKLRAALNGRGIEIEAAFPLLVLAEATPPLNEQGKPGIALLHTDEAAAVYWITRDGDRHALFIDGPTARERAIEELENGFSAFGDKAVPVFAVVNAGGGRPIDLAGIRQKPEKTLSAHDLLSRAGALTGRDIGNFLPSKPRFTWDHLCHAAAFLLFAFGLGFAGAYVAAVRAAQADIALQRSAEQALTDENARLRGNKAHLDQVNAILGEVTVARPVKLRFLESLNRARPAQISIRSVTLNEAAWTVAGFAHEGVNVEKGPYQAFLASFQKSGEWTIGPDSQATGIHQADFTLSGTIP